MKNLFSMLVKIKSNSPSSPAITSEMTITKIVKIVACLVVGHETCLNSPRVSRKYWINRFIPFK